MLDYAIMDARYAFRLVASLGAELESRAAGTTFPEISRDSLGAVPVPIPSLADQAAIARFLDHVDSRIQRLIAAKERLVELLEEEKQAIIHRAVTRGLDPDIPLKPSGVEWLADLPAHWRMQSLGQCLRKIEQGWSPVAAEGHAQEDQWAVLTLSAVRRGHFNSEAIKPIPLEADVPTALEIHPGDLLITRSNTRDRVGDACVVTDARPRTILSDLIYRLAPNARLVDVAFAAYFLLSPPGRHQAEQDARGSSGTMPKVTRGHIKSWRLGLPPVEEQRQIVDWIAGAGRRTDNATARARRGVSLLLELRTRLISDIVTGKLDVREAAAKLAAKPDARPSELEEALEEAVV